MDNDFEGFLELGTLLEEYAKVADNILDEEEKIAKEFVNDLLKLPRPRSNIKKSKHTHLVNSFAYEKTAKDVAVGWGKYYGRMVEEGTRKMKSQAHLVPLWNRNQEKYITNFKRRNNLM
jgi:HK97 gp10 family phage protein